MSYIFLSSSEFSVVLWCVWCDVYYLDLTPFGSYLRKKSESNKLGSLKLQLGNV